MENNKTPVIIYYADYNIRKMFENAELNVKYELTQYIKILNAIENEQIVGVTFHKLSDYKNCYNIVFEVKENDVSYIYKADGICKLISSKVMHKGKILFRVKNGMMFLVYLDDKLETNIVYRNIKILFAE